MPFQALLEVKIMKIPRKNPSEDSDNKESNFEEINNTNRTYTRKTKNRGFTRIKRTSPPTAYASIININNSSQVHVGSQITYTILNGSEKTDEEPKIAETTAIKVLKGSISALTTDDLLFVATHMNVNWRDVARALKFSDGQIDQFHSEYKECGLKEVIYQFLLDWCQNEPKEATVGNLASLLWHHNQRDVVRRWSENL
ncbi:hypothetical protein NQ315_010233 [Exocentrus adspersus]|uniref:Death domain-containing protein n=1 Tax=Exocentrus adspersus TaxID=1586481 RepID=A0AAV8WAR7_9CUCU|nr:hypothetical protein NQ315_010233 [Exocentrus adspersus]